MLKINTLIKEGVEIDSTALSTEENLFQEAKLMDSVQELVSEANSLQVNDDQALQDKPFTKRSVCTETVAKVI